MIHPWNMSLGVTTTSSQDDDLIQQLDNDNIEQIIVSGICTGRLDRVDLKHLAEIWRIRFDHGKWMQEPTLSENFGVNNWMLHYHCIHEDFFMDTFFVMS